MNFSTELGYGRYSTVRLTLDYSPTQMSYGQRLNATTQDGSYLNPSSLGHRWVGRNGMERTACICTTCLPFKAVTHPLVRETMFVPPPREIQRRVPRSSMAKGPGVGADDAAAEAAAVLVLALVDGLWANLRTLGARR